MHWSRRLLYGLAIPIAATPLLLSSWLARPVPAPAVATERAGLTLGEGRGRHVIVTSLRSGGPADRSGIVVGDELRDIAGQPITGAVMARRLINSPLRCDIAVDLRRDGLPHVARISQCSKKAGVEG